VIDPPRGCPLDTDEDVIVYNSWMIAKTYAKSWLPIDVVACLPIDVVLRVMEGRFMCSMNRDGCPPKMEGAEGSGAGQLLRLFKLLRLFRLIKLLRLFKILRLLEKYQVFLKPRLRVSRDAEDHFLIGRELISQGCDSPNENLVSIPAKRPILIQDLQSFFLRRSHRARGVFPVPIAFAKKFCAPHATTPVCLPERIRGEARKFRKFHF